jgi:DNA topoisomerase I
MDIIRKPNGFKLTKIKKKTRSGRITQKTLKIPKFIYLNKKTKKAIKDQKQLDRIKSLRIPPGYMNVEIAKGVRSKVQAIGEDDKGRKQYIYSKSYVKAQEKVKFNDLIVFGKNIEKIRSNVKKQLSKGNFEINKDSLIAIVLYLIDNCNFRVGCEKYKKLYNSYGVTTLNKKHLQFQKTKLTIEFIGKKGVLNKAVVTNKKMCSMLRVLCGKNGDEYLFQYDKHNNLHVTEKHVNQFLKKYDPKIKVKMFRTWNANIILLREILNYPTPETKTEADRNLKQIIESAAEKLHHTKTVSKSSYMNNKIIDLYKDDLEKFKGIFKDIKQKYNGKIPSVDKVLIELFIIFDKKK